MRRHQQGGRTAADEYLRRDLRQDCHLTLGPPFGEIDATDDQKARLRPIREGKSRQ
jgi:hypothetical protein